MKQINIFDPVLFAESLVRCAYQRGSETSKAAAEQARTFAPSQRNRIWAWLEQRGDRGGTQIEIAEALGIARQSICPRIRELETARLITKTVETRLSAVVYRAKELS